MMKGVQAAIRGRLRGRGVRLLLATLLICSVGACAAASSALALSPSVSTLAASNVADTTATLNGSVNPNGLETKTYFEYGPTVAYGSKTAEVSVGSGSSTLEKAQGVTGLTANTTYHYRIVATNSSGTSQGTDRTFTVGWVVQTPVSLGATGYFEDVSCSSATECTAVGVKEEGATAFAQRWNGTEWKSQTPAKPAEAVKTVFTGVSCPSSSTCYAVGQYTKAAGKWLTLIETWSGTEWKVQTSPTNAEATQSFLKSVSCSSTSECTAVGHYLNAGEADKTLALRWNGTEWSLQETKDPTSNSMQLRSVSCTSSTFCMAAGFYYYESKFVYTPFSERWDGTKWTIEEAKPVEGKMNWLYGVSCTSSTACTAVGAEEVEPINHETKTMARRWNGTEWSTQTMAKTEGGSSLADVSCTSSTACAAVGDSGSENPLEMRWDGSTWTLLSMPLPSGGNTVRPFGVSCIASRGCEAVGEYRLIGPTVYPLAEGRWRSAAPAVTTTAASEVGEKSATISGTVNPSGSETKAYFEYGTTTSYGSTTAEVNVGSGTSAVEKSAAISGLSPNTTYHYRFVANNENPETGKGEDKTFTTIGPPTVTTEAGVSEESGESATLNGVVNPNGQSTTYQFEYGTTSGVYTKTVPEPAESAGSGTTGKAVSYTITGLTRGTKYYFRITATNAGGKTTGSEHSFLTDSAPGATTSAATGITAHGATLKGTIAPHGLATKYQFEYGTTTSYGSKAPVSPAEVKPESESISVEQGVSGLAEETIYHYRLVAENALGSSTGEDKTFTTSATENVGSTVLCTEQKVKCPIGKADGTGTEIKANLVSGTKFKITTSFKTIECSKSSIKGKVAGTGEKISVSVETLTFEECNCTIVVVKKGELIFGHIASTDNATLTSNGAELTGNCSTIFGTVHCIYATSNTDMGTLEGGNPAKIKSSAANIPRLTTNGLCNEEASWDAEYEVTTPKPLYVET